MLEREKSDVSASYFEKVQLVKDVSGPQLPASCCLIIVNGRLLRQVTTTVY